MKRILYIEDSLASQWLLKKQLKTIVRLPWPASLAEARSLLQDHTKFDLVIADWALPDGEALEFVRELRKRVEATKLPVIVVSASMDSLLTAMAFARRGQRCFPKPIVWLDLIVAVERMLAAPLRSRHPKRAGSRHLVEGMSNGRCGLYCAEVNFLLDGEDADRRPRKAIQRVRENHRKRNPDALSSSNVR